MAPLDKLYPVGTLPDGTVFRKRQGEYAYIKMSESSVKFLKLAPEFVYGICYNGNVAKMKPTATVRIETLGKVVGNLLDEVAWNKQFCGDRRNV